MTHVKHLQRLLLTILIGALIEAGWHGLTACCGITGYEITIFEGALLTSAQPMNEAQLKTRIAQLEVELARVKKERELESVLQARIAANADRYFLQLEAIKHATFADIHGIVVADTEDFSGLEERE